MVKKQFFEKRKLIFTSVILMLAVFLAIMYQCGFINLQENKFFANTELTKPQNFELNRGDVTKVQSEVELLEVAEVQGDPFDYSVIFNWNDNDNANALRPEEIEIRLYQDGELYDTQIISEDTGWSCTFAELPAVDEETGNIDYSYVVEFDRFNGYKTTTEDYGFEMLVECNIEGITALTENIYVQKEWSDDDDSRGKRPETVTVNLYRDGELVESGNVSEDTDWKYVFTGMPKYKNSTENYEYTIDEVNDVHYDPTYNQNYATEIDIPKETPVDGETVSGLRLTFNQQTATEEGKDTINIYYKLGDTSYRLGSYSGTALAGQSIDIPSLEFWIYMYSDYIISGGYGFSIDNIEHVDVVVPAEADRETRSIPSVTATETSGDVYPESAHSPYGDDLKTLWHYDGESREDKLITNTYRIVESDVVVHYYLEGTTQKIRDDLVIEGYAWETYSVPAPEGIADYYEYVSNTDNLTGEFAEETTEVIYYYKYKTYDYKVEYYYEGVKDESKTENLTAQYADEISTYTDKVITGYEFNSTSTLPLVMTDNVDTNIISVYYTKRDDLSYTVKYLDSETKEEIAPEKIVSNQTFESVATETAIDVDGYVTPIDSKSITIDVDNNEIIFEYDKRTDLSYTVRYIEEDSKIALATEKVVNGQRFKDVITETAIEIDGYVRPTEAQNIEITTGNNVITFYYTKRQDLSVTIYVIDKDTNTDIMTPKVVENLEYLLEYTMELDPIDGYNIEGESSKTITIGTGINEIKFYVTKRNDLTYTIKYVDRETGEEIAPAKVVENQTYLSSVREDSIEIEGYVNPNAWYTFQIGTGTNEYKFEYDKRTDLSYTVQYLEEGTEKVLATNKVVENQTFKATVTEEAIAITGYVLKSDFELSTTIGVTDNVIKFYYTKRTDLSYTVRYIDNSTGEIIDSKTVGNQTFESVIIEEAPDIDGYNKLNPTSQDLKIIVGLNQLTFYYAKRTDLSYTVQFIDKETREEIAPIKVVEYKTFKDQVTEVPIEIDGYVKPTNAQTITIGTTDNTIIFEYEKRTDLKVIVSYIDKETGEDITLPVEWDGNTFKEIKTYEALTFDGYIAQNPTSQTIEITTGSNNVVFYYVKRKDLSYTVKYLDIATGEEIATAKIIENQTFKDIITEEAIEIDGYVKPETTSESIEITTGENIIEFKYSKRTDLSYVVKYIDSDTDEEIAPQKEELNRTFGESITETAIEIDGYVKPSEESKTITIKTSGNEIVFEYTKRNDLSYTVYYKDQATGEDLQEPVVEENRTFKEKIDCNFIEFDGYNLVSPETQTVEITTGENKVTFYYTKKNDLYYTVKYLEADTNRVLATDKVVTNQIFKDIVTETAIEINGFVKPETESQTIEIKTSENTIIFYYTKRTDLSYTVKYLEADTNNELAEEKVIENQTFEALVKEEAIEIEGYDKVNPISQEIEIKVDGNEIIFYYTKRTDLSYTVKYLEADTNNKLAEEKVVENQTFKAEITETAIDIDGYNKVSPTEQTIEIKTTGNEITFYYTKRTDLSYTVYYKDQETNEDLQQPIIGENQTFEDIVECSSIEFDGYNLISPEKQTIEITTGDNKVIFYYVKRTDLVYTVEYLENGTNIEISETKIVENQTFKAEVLETAIEIDGYNKLDPIEQTIEMTTGENKITFYYTKRTDLSYRVRYLDNETNEEIAPQKEELNRTFGESITETAIEIDGYVKPSEESQTITIKTSENEIIFEYTKRTDLSYTVKYLEKDTNEVLVEEKVVENQTFKDEIKEVALEIEGYDKVDPTEQTIEIKTAGNEITFYYTKRTDLSYIVKYLEKDTNNELAEEKVVENQTFKAEVTETAIDIDGFIKPDPANQTIEIKTAGNEIIFYYARKSDLTYVVKYLEKDTNEEIAEEKIVENQVFEAVVKEEAIEIDGYVKPEETTQEKTMIAQVNEFVFYYTKRTDLSYTVKYLDKETNEELAEEKVVENQTFKAQATEEAIEIEGYVKPEATSETIEITTGENIINFYYTKRSDLSYVVKYIEEETGAELAEEKVVENQRFKAEVTETAIDIAGYVKVDPAEQTIEIKTTGNEITFYYTKNTNLKYTIEYYYEGVKDDSKTVDAVGTYLDVVDAYENKVITGYEEVDKQNFPLTISSNEDENIIKIYYEKARFEYTVHYFYDGVEDTTKVETSAAKFEEKITEYIEKPITGYVLKEISELTITEKPENNVLNIYYEKGQFAYSIHYYYQGIEDVSKVENGMATYGDIINTYTDKNITGYKFDSVDNENLTITENAANNIMNVYYIKDSFEYTVEYYYDGTIDRSETVTDIAAFEEIIEEYEDKVIPGYELVETENVPLTITEKTENNIIKIYYEKAKFNYTVHYYYEGIENISKVEKFEATYLDVIENYEDKNITGYKLESVDNLPLTVSEIEADNAINVYYVKDTFEYTVHYFYEGVEDTDKLETLTAKYEDVITTYTDKNITDFKLVKEENLPLRITEDSKTNVINVYYEKNMFEYKVKYFYDGVENEELEETILGKFGSQITEYPEKNIPGYKLEKTAGLPLTIEKEVENNVIEIYYIKDYFEYRVEYYYDGVINSEKTEKNVALYDSKVTEYIDKNIEGYKLEKVEGTPLTIKEIVQNNVIKVYYVIDEGNTKEISYTVKYYKDGVLDEEATQVVSERVQVLQPDYMEVRKTEINIVDKYDGYKLDATQTKEIPNFVNSGDVIEIYYIRKDAIVVVHYYERNSETELSETVTISGKVFDEYTTEPTEVEGYTLVANSENTAGTMEENEIIVTYYYAKNVKATIKHVDIATGDIVEEEVIDTKDGDILEVTAKDIENYVLIQSPEDTTIEVGKEDIVVTFYYSHVSEGVIEKHIDKITNEVIETNVYQGKEGDNYTTSTKEIEGYDLVLDLLPENAEGTMTVDVIEVKYYYIRKASVVVEYVDYITGEKLLEKDEEGEDKDSTIVGEGHENDEYTTNPKEFDGYVLVETPENATGTMKVERTVDEEGNSVVNTVTKVIYKYGREASVRVEYYDIETNEKIAEDDIIEGYEGKEYSVEAKTIAKYAISETPDNTEGIMKIEETINEETGEVTENSEIVVIFKYMKKDGKVIVRYIDKATDTVLDETEITGKIDTEYETQEKEITDYTYLRDEKPANATGTITEETIIVNYYYVKVAKVVVQYKDKFTGEVVYEREVYEGYEGEEYTTVPPEVDGYVLVTEEYPNNAEGKYELEPQEVTYYYARKTMVEVSYVDMETGAELLEKEIIEGKEGDRYTTEAKEVNYYKLYEVENAEGVMKVETTTDEETGIEKVDVVTKVIYKYRKANFDIAVEKTVKEVIVDGTNRRVNNNKLVKVEIHRKEISEANVKVIYQVKVTNNGELPGRAIISDVIPEGLTFDSSVNKAWTPKGEQAYVETSELKPGESATYEIILTWNGKDEIGTFTNQIEVVSVENTPDYEEVNTRNNKSEATVIIVTSTGIEMIINQIDIKTVGNIGMLSLYFVLAYVFVIKRKRD